MQPEIKEITIAYAACLREKAHDGCNFGSMCDERILEHLIETIEDSALIQKCISKSGTLQEFLTAARQTEDISTQMHWNKNVHKVRQIYMSLSGPDWSCGQDQLCLFLKIGLATGNHVSQYHL